MFKSFIKSVKIYSTIVSLLAFTPLWASPDLSEPTDNNKGIHKPLLDIADEIALANGAVLPPSNFVGAWYTHLSLREFLNKNRLMWYMGFAGTGCGLLVSNAFEIESQEMYAPWILGGLAVGLTAGATTKYFINKNCPGADNILKKRGPNIAAGLSSFIPWIIFGATQPNNPP